MDFKVILSHIKKKQFDQIYLAYGEEDYYIDRLTDILDTTVLTDDQKAFNRTVAYGKEVKADQLLDHLRRYPMMSSHQLVILKEAQAFNDWDGLVPYFQNPNPATVFMIAYKAKSPDKRKKWFKSLKDAPSVCIMESKRVYENKIPAWIDQYLKSVGKKISPEASRLLSIFVGNKLSNVVNELDKLLILIEDKPQIDLEHIEQNIGVSRHYNVFELQDALGDRNISKVNYIVKNLVDHLKTQPLILIIPAIHSFFSKVYALKTLSGQSDDYLAKALGIYSKYFVKDYRKAAKNYTGAQLERIFDMLHRYDRRLKGIDGSRQKEEAILEELVQHIIYA